MAQQSAKKKKSCLEKTFRKKSDKNFDSIKFGHPNASPHYEEILSYTINTRKYRFFFLQIFNDGR